MIPCTSHLVITVLTFFVFSIAFCSGGPVTEENCEVCVKLIRRFYDQIPDADKSNHEKIATHFKKFCAKTRGKDERFCYYVGGLKTSATYIVKEMAQPLSWGMPAEKTCEKLRTKDMQICELKYEKKEDLKKANFQKMRVRTLKKILDDWGERCLGCTEKSDYIKLIEEKMPVYDPEAYKFRQAKKTEL